jgi:hypothetical protein
MDSHSRFIVLHRETFLAKMPDFAYARRLCTRRF